MQRICLYLEELARVQNGPDARRTELTDVVVTDISPLRLPPARPYEYLPNAGESAVLQLPQSTVVCHIVYGEGWQCFKVWH